MTGENWPYILFKIATAANILCSPDMQTQTHTHSYTYETTRKREKTAEFLLKIEFVCALRSCLGRCCNKHDDDDSRLLFFYSMAGPVLSSGCRILKSICSARLNYYFVKERMKFEVKKCLFIVCACL